MKRQELNIEGMSCNHCVMAVKKALSNVAGITVETVEIGKARVQYDETKVNESQLALAIEEAGYKLVGQTTVASSQ
ncbi:MAG: copper chaperone [Bacteroidetes bacterium]|nr:MAG: copper chaperone [Bacteroidota bacterium]